VLSFSAVIRPARLLIAILLVSSCVSAPPPAPPPPPTYAQKVSAILRLEDHRVLREATPQRPVAAAPAGAALSSAPAPDLVQLLTDAEARVRRRAALAIGRVGLVEGVTPLAQALSDTDPEVRQMAAFALGLIGDGSAGPPLATALSDPSPVVRGRAAEALGQVGAKDRAGAIAVMVKGLVDAGALSGIAPDEIGYPLAPEAEAVRLGLYALCRLQHYEALADASLDPSGRPVSEWWPIAYAFGRVNDPRAGGPLRALLAGQSRIGRAFAARGLGANKVPGAADLLVPVARNVARDPGAGIEALRALAMIEAPQAAPALVDLVRARDLDPTIRFEAATTLAHVAGPAQVDVLLDLLTDRVAGVRAQAYRALAHADPERFWLTLSGLDPDPDWSVRAALATTLGTLPAEAAASLAVALANDQDARVQPAALAALAALGAADQAPLLVEKLGAEDPVVRAAAAEALGTLKAASAAGALMTAFEAAARDQVYNARTAILEALLAIDPAQARPLLERALQDADWAVRVRAAALLKKIEPSLDTSQRMRPAPSIFDAAAYEAPQVVEPPYSTHVYLDTDKGTIEIELAVLDAPLTVHNFVRLARKGFFDGLAFHRVVPGFVVQDGDPRGDGNGSPGYTIRDEINERPYLRGTVGMALDWEDTGGSQYFITHGPQPHLDGRYTVFGQVVSGMEIVDALASGDVVRHVRVWDGSQP
jgi:cyclophilin family peptidyl-prolyl cis-trans isomerase/HEAT repeat protein